MFCNLCSALVTPPPLPTIFLPHSYINIYLYHVTTGCWSYNMNINNSPPTPVPGRGDGNICLNCSYVDQTWSKWCNANLMRVNSTIADWLQPQCPVTPRSLSPLSCRLRSQSTIKFQQNYDGFHLKFIVKR